MARTLTKLQRAFIREYCSDPKMGQTEAAAKAGYSRARAKITAIELMKHPDVHAEIERHLSGKIEKATLSPETVSGDLQAIDDACKAVGASSWALTVRLKIVETRAKILRMFDERPVQPTDRVSNSLTVQFVNASGDKYEKPLRVIEALPQLTAALPSEESMPETRRAASREEPDAEIVQKPETMFVNGEGRTHRIECPRHGVFTASARRLPHSKHLWTWSFCPVCQDEARKAENQITSLLPGEPAWRN